MITITAWLDVVTYEFWKYPGGEIGVRLKGPNYVGRSITITALLDSSDEIMKLMMLTSAVREKFGHNIPINLVMPYLPYARQDRVCSPGEALSVKVMCILINSLHFVSVEVWDAHSNVSTALLDRCTNVHCIEFVKNVPASYDYLVSPDAGSFMKVLECAKHRGTLLIEALKHRDSKTGQITGMSLVENEYAVEKNAHMLIVDDICDGGRTFVELALVLYQKFNKPIIDLYVTHGIFSKGLEPFKGLINQVYCANPFPGTPQEKIIKVERTNTL